ncbi:uracil dna glycosylase superfamily protein, partial [Lasallia pustulata]
MASRENPARSKLKAFKSGSMKQYLSLKTASAVKPPSEDKLGEKSLSALDHDVEESKDKPDDLETTLPQTRSDVPSSSFTRPSKRKRLGDAPTPETSLASPRENCSKKKPRRSKEYAPPSTYDHLPALPDTITLNLICLFVGLNPGIQTATKGHPYAHPSNLYWSLLHSSGLTPDRRLAPAEYVALPERYALGNTNIVGRATRDGAELSKDEMVAGARVLDDKVRRWRPEAVCLVGKSIWEAVWKWKYGRTLKPKEFRYGFQDAQENMGRS